MSLRPRGAEESGRIARSRQDGIPSRIRVPRGKTELLRRYLGQVGVGQFMMAERMDDRKPTTRAELRPLDVSILSALCQQFVGGHICDAWFANSGIKEKRGGL
jgi:hypothetical protein